MDKHPIGDLMDTTMQKIREMVDANTIVGDPIVTGEGVTLIPVSKVTFGFTSGGSDFHGKNQPATADNSFGGGAGAGVNIVPVAFLVVKGESVKILNIAPPVTTTIDRVIETVPDVIDRVSDFVRERKKEDADK
ncbi:MAG: GerW family sporulation protein [Oscillospiraceae bacterium]|nr:GerW family sporulation protein [Oscillospiraceae bacterium]